MFYVAQGQQYQQPMQPYPEPLPAEETPEYAAQYHAAQAQDQGGACAVQQADYDWAREEPAHSYTEPAGYWQPDHSYSYGEVSTPYYSVVQVVKRSPRERAFILFGESKHVVAPAETAYRYSEKLIDMTVFSRCDRLN